MLVPENIGPCWLTHRSQADLPAKALGRDSQKEWLSRAWKMGPSFLSRVWEHSSEVKASMLVRDCKE